MTNGEFDAVQQRAESSLAPYRRYAEQRESLAALVDELASVATAVVPGGEAGELDRLATGIRSANIRLMFVGAYSTGKSSLINALLGVSTLPAEPFPSLPQTTVVRSSTVRYRFPPVPDGAGDHGGSAWDEVFIDSPLCRLGVEFVESAQWERDIESERVAMNFLAAADVVIFVSTPRPLDSAELQFAERIRTFIPGPLIFVCNKVDLLSHSPEPARREAVRVRLEQAAGPDRSGEPVLLSARTALEGRLTGDPALVAESGILDLERVLADLMTAQVVPNRLSGFADAVRKRTASLGSLLPQEHAGPLLRRLLGTGTEEPPGQPADIRHLDELVEAEAARISLDAERLGRDFYEELAARVPSIVEAFQPTRTLQLNPLRSRDQVASAAAEIANHLGSELERESARWTEETLTPFLDGRFAALSRAVGRDLGAVAAGLPEMVAVDASRFRRFPSSTSSSPKALAVGMLMLGATVLTPVGVMAGLLAGGVTAMVRPTRMINGLKQEVVAQTVGALRASAPDFGRHLASTVGASLESYRRDLHERITTGRLVTADRAASVRLAGALEKAITGLGRVEARNAEAGRSDE